jgi:sugar/nucleoside kinase (ribokinase family)
MLDILCIGDCKIDIFLKIPDNNSHFGLDKEKNKLFLSYGEKIYIDRYVLGIGGNATNTGVGIARLGMNVGLCAEIGKDEFSKKILEELRKENINTDFLSQTDKETSISIGLNYKGDRTLFTEHVQREHHFNFTNLETKFIYLTSLGNIWETTYQKALQFKETHDTKLAFNPGTIQLEKRGKVFMDILEQTDYLFVNRQEAEEILYGKELGLTAEKESQIKKLLYGLRGLGAKNVVITDGDNGSFVEDENNQFYSLAIEKVNVVEKTGAGDAYTAGFLTAVINGRLVEEAMRWGALDSASVVQKIGAEEGLLKKMQLEEQLKSAGVN